MKKHFGKRILALMLAVVMCFGAAMPAVAVGTDSDVRVTVEQVDNSNVTAKLPGKGSVELTEEDAPYDANDVVRVSIVLEKAGTIEVGYAPFDIANNVAAMNYRADLELEQTSIITKIENKISSFKVVWNLTLAANIISAEVKYGDIETIEAIMGVKSVLIETRYDPCVLDNEGVADPNMSTSGKQIGSFNAYLAGYTGAGSRIAIIDTGTDIDHLSFNSEAFLYALAENAEKAGMPYDEYVASLDLLDAEEIAAVYSELNISNVANEYPELDPDVLYLNDKLPYAYNYVDRTLDVAHLIDSQGAHGSHVAGIATANRYVSDGEGGFVNALDTVYVQGVAPDAQLLTMKVFGVNGGAYESDYMAAIEDAIILGCDAVNLSLGLPHPGGSRSSEPAYQAILDRLVDSGMVLSIASGNASYWAAQSQSGYPYLYLEDVSMQMNGTPGTFTNALNVASVQNDGYTLTAYIRAGDKVVEYVDNSSIDAYDPLTTLAGEQEFVFLNSFGTPEQWDALGVDLTGKVAICYRGGTKANGDPVSFFEKANAAVERGAIGVIICNNVDGVFGMNLAGYLYSVPAVSITLAASYDIRAAGTAVTGNGVDGWTGTIVIGDGVTIATGQYNSAYYTMSDFSSWGIPGSLELKPEITAPGGNVYSVAGALGTGVSYDDHASYVTMSGTSMAAPQVTGMSAVLAQYVREAGLPEKTGLDVRTLVQALLMSTSVPLRDATSNGNYYSIMQQGAGLANVGAAVMADSYILMGADATASYADGKVKAELGDDPDKTGVYTFSFTINNLTDVDKEFLLSADVFTQNWFTVDGIDLLDTRTTSLAPVVTWTADGQSVAPNADLFGMDFNGDGIVSYADGQALLDYATGVRTELTNADRADLDTDGNIDSHDAYAFFCLVNEGTVAVAANGTTEITVTISLTDADREQLAAYPNGAYIEAFVYAESLATDEGVSGTVHSIPVIGFYGNWSDASMFDKGSFVEYYYGLETKAPYLYQDNYRYGRYNTFTVDFGGTGEYVGHFGGNPVMAENEYLPERNAINGVNGTKLAQLGFTNIRQAADSYLWLKDTNTGEYYLLESLGSLVPAFYWTNFGVWQQRYWVADLGFTLADIADIPDGTALEMGLTLIPEYYMMDGELDMETFLSLGEGATFSLPMVVDNIAPTIDLDSVVVDLPTLTLDITDNHYVAGVFLLNGSGDTVLAELNPNQTEAGVTTTVTLDVLAAAGAGTSFMLQVYDFAMNVTTYRVTLDMLPDLDTHYMFFDKNNRAWYGYTEDGSEGALMGWCDLDLVAAEYVDGYVFAFDENCNFYVMADNDFANYTYITTVIDDGPLDPENYPEITDMAYNPDDGLLYFMVLSDYDWDYSYLYTVDMYTGEVEQINEMDNIYYTLAIDDTGTFYSQDGLFGEMYTFRMDDFSYFWPEYVGELSMDLLLYYSDCALAWDSKNQELVFTYCDESFLGEGEFASIFLVDPVTLETEELVAHENISPLVGAYIRNGEPDLTRFAPTDKAMYITLSEYEHVLGVGVNDTFTLTATVQPWNLTDHSVVWTSSDDSIATVDANGNVLAHDLGTVTITATSAVDPSVSASCEVEVKGNALSLTGMLQNADRDSKFFSWNMEETATWEETGDLDTSMVSGTYDKLNEKIYVMDYVTDSWSVHVVEPSTGVTEVTYANNLGHPLWDMEYSTVFSTADAPVVHGVYSNYLLVGMDPSDLSTATKFDLSPYLEYGWGRFVVGVASSGESLYAYNGVVYETEHLIMIDDMGDVISAWVYDNGDGTYGAFFDVTWCGLYFNFDGWRDNVIGSMVFGSDGLLYLSAFDGEVNELWALSVYDEKNVGSETCIGTFGDNVWPVILLDVSSNGIGTQSLTETGTVADIVSVSGSGSLNSTVTEAEDQTTLTVELTAKDSQGVEVDTTNGVQTVTYDPSILKLVGVTVNGNYYSVNRQDDEGKVTIGYVDMDGIPAGQVAAVLEFEVIDSRSTDISVDHREANADDQGYAETLNIQLEEPCQHVNTEIRGAKDATCTEDGYTGDTYCADCGELLEVGEVIPAAGHNLENGKCTECGYIDYLMGDVNGDGLVDTTDAKLIMQLDLGLVDGSALNLDAADVNGDGLVDTTDAKLVMQKDLDLIDKFPVED